MLRELGPNDYEELSRLDEGVPVPANRLVPAGAIGEILVASVWTTECAYDTCAICMEAFRERENVVELPQCCHVFHRVCVTKWLTECKGACPIDGVPVVIPHIEPRVVRRKAQSKKKEKLEVAPPPSLESQLESALIVRRVDVTRGSEAPPSASAGGGERVPRNPQNILPPSRQPRLAPQRHRSSSSSLEQRHERDLNGMFVGAPQRPLAAAPVPRAVRPPRPLAHGRSPVDGTTLPPVFTFTNVAIQQR